MISDRKIGPEWLVDGLADVVFRESDAFDVFVFLLWWGGEGGFYVFLDAQGDIYKACVGGIEEEVSCSAGVVEGCF